LILLFLFVFREMITERQKHTSLLREKFLSGRHDSVTVERMFNEICGESCHECVQLCQHDVSYIIDMVLSTATEYNHRDLITLMLENEFYVDDYQTAQRLVKPLLVAMNKGNLHLMKVFLHAGASMTLECTEPMRLVDTNYTYTTVSAIECACLLKKLDVFKVLVAHDSDSHRHRYVG